MSDQTKVQTSTNAEEIMSSQPIAKPNVSCSFSRICEFTFTKKNFKAIDEKYSHVLEGELHFKLKMAGCAIELNNKTISDIFDVFSIHILPEEFEKIKRRKEKCNRHSFVKLVGLRN